MTAPTFTRNGSPFTPVDTTILKLVRGGTLPSVGALLRNGVSFPMIDTRPLRWHQGSTNPAGILDTLGVTAKLALSTRRLRAAYAGACIQVRRSSDNTTQDIGFDGSGNLDTREPS
jgi:hypothetical protein